MKKYLFILMMTMASLNIVNAQTDAGGCKDHPLLSRLENFYISECEENYNELQLRTGSNKTETKEE